MLVNVTASRYPDSRSSPDSVSPRRERPEDVVVPATFELWSRHKERVMNGLAHREEFLWSLLGRFVRGTVGHGERKKKEREIEETEMN